MHFCSVCCLLSGESWGEAKGGKKKKKELKKKKDRKKNNP